MSATGNTANLQPANRQSVVRLIIIIVVAAAVVAAKIKKKAAVEKEPATALMEATVALQAVVPELSATVPVFLGKNSTTLNAIADYFELLLAAYLYLWC